MAKKEIQIQIKKLNNKSRKGDYVYLRLKGNKGRYLKLRDGVPLEEYRKFYINKIIKEKAKRGDFLKIVGKYTKITRKIKKQKKRLAKVDKKASKLPKINTLFKKGVYEVQLGNVLKANNKNIKMKYQELIQKAIKKENEKWVKTVSKEENIKKLKGRFENRITVYGYGSRIILGGRTIGTKTPYEVVKDVKRLISEGQEYDYNLISRFALKGKYNMKEYDKRAKNKIRKVDMSIIFRKG